MPIQTKNAAKVRSILQTYFQKKAGQMPTKSEWLNVLNSFVSIADDLALDLDDIEGLQTALDKKLNADDLPEPQHIPTAEEIFDGIKTAIESLIDEKTADIKAAAEKPTILQLRDMVSDVMPVGTIAQYIGNEDEQNRLYRGYFYEKIKEHNPEGENTPGTQDGDQVSIQNVARVTLDGETFITNYSRSDADENTQIITCNDRYFVFMVAKEAVLNPHENHLNRGDFSECFPVAYDIQNNMLVTTSWEECPNTGGKLELYVNGENVTNARNASHRAQYAFRESDGKPFVIFDHETTQGHFQMVVPRYADNLYDIEADEERYYFGDTAASRVNSMSEWFTITPKLPFRNGEGYNTDPAWKMIQVSPFILED